MRLDSTNIDSQKGEGSITEPFPFSYDQIGSVPVAIAAKVYRKDPNWVRAGIIAGWLPIGIATRDGQLVTDISMQNSKQRINYYISPKLLYEQTGYIWKGTD